MKAFLFAIALSSGTPYTNTLWEHPQKVVEQVNWKEATDDMPAPEMPVRMDYEKTKPQEMPKVQSVD